MDEALVLGWIRTVWCRCPGSLLNLSSILVLHAFCGHLVDAVKKLLGDVVTHLVVIPGGMTSQLQPLDVCINKLFEDWRKRVYAD